VHITILAHIFTDHVISRELGRWERSDAEVDRNVLVAGEITPGEQPVVARGVSVVLEKGDDKAGVRDLGDDLVQHVVVETIVKLHARHRTQDLAQILQQIAGDVLVKAQLVHLNNYT
jgi:hypothetical protein